MAIEKVVGAALRQAVKVSETNTVNVIKTGASILKGAVPLKADVVELSAAATRWTKPAQEYIPNVVRGAKGFAVPMHHELNGENLRIRSIIKGIKKNSLTEMDKDFLEYRLKDVYSTDKAFAELTPLEKDVIGYRGRTEHPFITRFNEDISIVKKAKPGDVITPDEAYSYLGFDRGLADVWCCRNNSDNLSTVMYTIRIPKGAKVSRNLEHGGEIVMPRGAQYKVVSKEVKGNHTEITLEYLLPKKDNLAEITEFMKKYNVKVPQE